ncbi:isochorismate synthase [Lacihabitans sp. LS3-19]|uniref:chorismate-binding protein n=1 Tax=Lacihabitans sp. LS3-19 TaxID=2487335 RepID=UPI0020CEF317|nr:chorismate-binding protein [Lacihabitans sp. LS3-19]MCP9769116.1 isochorismate synthase [Lacihabitans sp. LS3-19]
MIAIDSEIKIKNIIEACIEQKYPFALYRLPNQNLYKLIISFDKNQDRRKIDFEECGAGFVLAPYDTNELPYFYKSDLSLDLENLNNVELSETQLLHFKQISESPSANFDLKLSQEIENKEAYLGMVESTVNHIKNGEAKKVVLSRKKQLGSLLGNNYLIGFEKLCNAYSSAFVSLVNVPWKNQIWLGASPEILVSQNEMGIFKTVALAGTQTALDSHGNEIQPIDALWSHKEIEEQALVGRYIINCFKKIRVREYLEEGPKTVKAGNLLHLNSSYLIDTKEVDFPNLSSVMLDLLHPTSAVCGMPKEAAEKIIAQIETHDREFYSGYLGPVNIENASQLYVNIRTMKIENQTIFAFAGGGITEDSDPEKEWNETKIKIQTILKSFD